MPNANDKLNELKRKFEIEQAKLEEEAKKELENKIVDEYPQPIPPIEEAKGLTESERQDYSQSSSQNISDSGINNNPQYPSSATVPNRSWESVKTGYLQSFLSVKFQIFVVFMGFLGILTYKSLVADNSTMTIAIVGIMTTQVNIYLGLRAMESNKDKDIEAKKEIEKIKVTPLNESIVSELKKVIPIQGLG